MREMFCPLINGNCHVDDCVFLASVSQKREPSCALALVAVSIISKAFADGMHFVDEESVDEPRKKSE